MTQAFLEGIILDTTVLDKITAEIRPRAARIVQTYGFAIASDAAQKSPKDTHALENSILAESKMIGEMTFLVSDGVEYGVYQEFGTSRIAAQPFMIPAIEDWRERFLAEFGAELFKP